MKFKKIKKMLTPSGMWDNGYYEKSDEVIEIPDTLLKEKAITQDMNFLGVGKGKRITIDGVRYNVENEEV